MNTNYRKLVIIFCNTFLSTHGDRALIKLVLLSTASPHILGFRTTPFDTLCVRCSDPRMFCMWKTWAPGREIDLHARNRNQLVPTTSSHSRNFTQLIQQIILNLGFTNTFTSTDCSSKNHILSYIAFAKALLT